MSETGCVVVGGGPAGMVLGLLLARAGVRVTVLEKHSDFLRDFRGDTVHASTLTLLDELGLSEEFEKLHRRLVDQITVQLDAGAVPLKLRWLPGPHKHIALVPQWDFLEMLASAAEREPSFTLRRNAEVTGLLTEGGRVVGVRYRDRGTDGDGQPGDPATEHAPATGHEPTTEHELRAALTVACDGRGSTVRDAAGLRPREFGVPMDVWWFRLPRKESDPIGAVGRFSTGHVAVMLDRGDYWQCAYLIRKGSDSRLRAAGVQLLRSEFAGLVPWTEDRMHAITSWDDVKLLNVSLNRLRRWSSDGLLLIGDAAHAMSPVGGVGINLAVADAVAAARIVAPALRAGRVSPGQLRRVQRRRWWPTAVIQGGQRLAHRFVLGRKLEEDPGARRLATRLPLPMRVLRRFPVLSTIPAFLVAIGPLPEHAPGWARRRPESTRSAAE
ncbi:MAG TPA: FAD-dependent oxidoreductase [Pseudonocardia sp.]|uniref:FAD-dependent oxidoreductase n=1 Tax=Pseudonocardia sp. TaxID=60912 RepID=UPI002ED7F3B9